MTATRVKTTPQGSASAEGPEFLWTFKAHPEIQTEPGETIRGDVERTNIAIPFRGDRGSVQGGAIYLEAHARAQVFIQYEAGPRQAGPDQGTMDRETQLFRTSLEIHLGPYAQLELFVLSSLPAHLMREAFDQLTLEEGSHLRWTDVGFDAGKGTYERNVTFVGKESELDFAGAYGAACSTEGTYLLTTHHRGPRTKSRVYIKSALKDSAHLIFKGLIHIEESAAGSDAYLSNRNLVLNDGVRAESLPQLKIETDDVVCSHGSTTGGPREEELFYLTSRGLDTDSAKSLLVEAHLSAVLDRLPEDSREAVERRAFDLLGLYEGGSCS